MATHRNGAAKRLVFSLAAGAALSSCVYDPYYPYYGAYDAAPASSSGTVASTSPYYYPYSYAYPYSYYAPYGYYYPYRYVGPPISFNFGYYHYGGHGWGGGGHGWGGGGGHWGGGHGHR
ncbi:MAG: hypothetical protein WCC39_00445 [Telluria sp.]